ncbi:MAG: PD-(D/E)XK nuclease family protein [Duncaniella sp.]|nr:PD-(D/E)XK nuclease family protein [Duncaniella sp.]
MTPFLRQVAQVYIGAERDALADYCFIFTNKRAATFFEHYLSELAGDRPLIMPHTTTISEMVRSLSDLTPVSRLDAIFLLYHKYKDLMTAPEGADDNDRLDFDRFLFWGEMLLSDFNDVDRYMVDPARLFVNLKRVREIATDFLTPLQKEVLSRYWGEVFAPTSPDEFWKHVNSDPERPDAPEGKFVRLWEVLLELYTSFQETLRSDGLGTDGMMIRQAVERLRADDPPALPFKRYIFVGFNVITVSEFIIMTRLREMGKADFYWDFESPAFAMKENRAARFMRRNILNFPSRYPIPASTPSADPVYPEITVTGVPSAIGQAKLAGQTIAGWIKDGSIRNPGNAIGTAVVLPDESLFMSMINAVPESITSLNVTMGFPLRTTPFASFMDTLIHMHSEATFTYGEWHFFYRDVTSLLTHPLLNRLDRNGCTEMLSDIAARRLYMVPASLLEQRLPVVATLFRPLEVDRDSLSEGIYTHLHEILLTLLDSLSALMPGKTDSSESADGETEEVDDSDGRDLAANVDIYYIRAWLAALEELKSAIDRRGISMSEETFLLMLRRSIGSASINFAGKPLSGLQVMGVLETRSLDFDNLIILSMNERVFPQKIFTRSFIPDSLRRAYGMATTDHQESIFSYYFYRLISRASHVTLLYDNRDSGIGSSEVSRYVAQLLYLFPESKVRHRLAVFPALPAVSEKISIPKDEKILRFLDEYSRPGGRNLSVTAIKTFLKCPLQFYLKYFGHVSLRKEEMEHIDAITVGNVFHKVAENLYNSARKPGHEGPVSITARHIDSWTGDKASVAAHIDPLVTRAVNEFFNRLPDSDRPLTGEARAMGNVVTELMVSMLRSELPLTPFEYIAGEYPLRGTLRIAGRDINIFQIIDRIDRIRMADGTERLRFVDYKTGNDLTEAPAVGEWFTGKGKRPDALIQLMFYCCAYASEQHFDGPIKPVVYKVTDIKRNGITNCKIGKNPLEDYREYAEEYMSELDSALAPLFDPDTPFTQTDDIKNSCEYCDFRTICRR